MRSLGYSVIYTFLLSHTDEKISIYLLWFYQKIEINFRWTIHRGLWNFVLKILYLIQLFLSIKYQDIQVSCKTSNKDKILLRKPRQYLMQDARQVDGKWKVSTGCLGFSSNGEKSYKWNKDYRTHSTEV